MNKVHVRVIEAMNMMLLSLYTPDEVKKTL
jgi:hypothetical protein